MSVFSDLDKKLAGAPDTTLTLGLIFAGIVAWLVALFGTPTFKVVVLTWMVAP
jgi:hypothetical protein